MSRLWDKVKKEGKKIKVQGEIQLLKRELLAREKAFGVALYDLLTNDKQTLLGVTAGTLFKGALSNSTTTKMKEPLERAREDIAGIQAKKDVKQKDLDVLEVKGAHTLPDYTLGQKANKVGAVISNGAKETKLQAEMALLDREIKIRKEQFGVEVMEQIQQAEKKAKNGSSSSPSSSSSSSSLLKRVSLSGQSQQEQEIQKCINDAKADVAKIEAKIQSKQFEIHAMNDGETEPMVM